MKRIISIAMSILTVMTMLPSYGSAAFDDGSKDCIQLQTTSNQMISISKARYDELVIIPQEEAKEVAMLFVKDEILLGDVIWDDNTHVVDIIEMYDESDSGRISAYTVRLTEGYVVVSAYRDAASLIPEWSDRAEPLFDAFEKTSSDNVLYLGPYSYYLDNGSTISSLDGHEVERESLINKNAPLRDSSNIPKSVISEIFSSASNPGIKSNPGEISDPIAHANSMYAGPFVCNDYINYWGNYIMYYTMDYGESQGYSMHCGPTAITNLIVAYKNRYQSPVSTSTANAIFNNVAQIGINNGYYTNGVGTGMSTSWLYIWKAFNHYNINSTASYLYYTFSYNAVQTTLSNNDLMFVELNDNTVYDNHDLVCFAYTRLVSQSTGYYKTYLKVADGWNNSGRYIDLSTVLSDSFHKVYF